MDGARADSGERVVEDEFACPGMLRGSLTSLHAAAERIFRVHFSIGADQPPRDAHGQIWLKLRGLSADVRAAKLFVKGVVNQEEQQEVPYPAALHCVFSGARGLFMDCLVRNTSALIVIGSPGCLLISGLMEPVVRAYSLITDLVERCDSSQPKRTEPGERGPGESLESRRAFKKLVEQWDDRHTLDLLVLPGSVKEILLDLIKDARLGDNPRPLQMDVVKRDDTWDKAAASFGESGSRAASGNFLHSFGESGGARGSPEGTEERSKSPQEVGEEDQALDEDNIDRDDETQWAQLSGSKEFWLLLKFFTAMGYTEDVVQRVLAKTGLQEASQILDIVQQEQDRTDKELREGAELTQSGTRAKELRNKPCETEHREDGARSRETVSGRELGGAMGGAGGLRTEDFVLGVLKEAAASCGYNEKQVTEVYSKHPEQSMHEILLELQRNDSVKHSGYSKEGPREMDDVTVEAPKVAHERTNRENGEGKSGALPKRQSVDDDAIWVETSQAQNAKQQKKQDTTRAKRQGLADNIRGPPLSSYNSNNSPHFANTQASNQASYSTTRPQPSHVRRSEAENGSDWLAAQSRDRRGQQGAVVVTGEQRFLEGLHLPFKMQLTNSQGKGKLRNIVIDGSNVAMSHGLGHFFSCRGIALAVQHFWDRGHRQISVLVPQWRSKSDHRIKEQHYLTELKELGIVSFTPSREVQGKRISAYDDRLMLQLAQKTDGVIVTNDNLRDLSDESAAWTDIIKKRLLQYTFVGDLFMVPDDPLGRGGPHLDEFLSAEVRFPDSGHALVPFPPNYRDRSPGGAGSRQGKETWTKAGARPERSPEETSRLRQELGAVFPGQENMVTLVLQSHPHETDINALSALLLEEN